LAGWPQVLLARLRARQERHFPGAPVESETELETLEEPESSVPTI
jgi:hypothetical protein